MNLLPALEEMRRQIQKVKSEKDMELHELEQGLDALKKLNTYCESCGGVGKTLRSRACAEDDRPDENDPRDWRKCNYCGGTGRVRYVK